MSNFNLGIDELIGFQVESTADWRRRKAEQFPDDSRNLEAAEKLDQLAKEIGELEGSDLHRRIDALIKLTPDAAVESVYRELSELVSEELRGLVFAPRTKAVPLFSNGTVRSLNVCSRSI